MKSKSIVLFIGAQFVLGSCAFKDDKTASDQAGGQTPKSLPETPNDKTANETSISIETSISGVSVSRDLKRETDQKVVANEFITLSSKPEPVLTFVIKTENFKKAGLDLTQTKKAEAYFRNPENAESHLVADFAMRDDGATFEVGIQGLQSALPYNEAKSGRLFFKLYGESAVVLEAEIPVRTPPGAVTLTTLRYYEILTREDSFSKSLRNIEINKRRLNLILAALLKNPNPLAVSIQFEKHPKGGFGQLSKTMSYNDLGCNYSYREEEYFEIFSRNLSVLPLNNNTVKLAETAVLDTDPETTVTVTLEPEEEILLGVYAMGSAADRWQDQGPFLPDVQDRMLNTTCRKECVERHCDREPDRPEPNRCRCLKEKTVQNQGPFTVGTNRYSVSLIFENIDMPVTLRYPDRPQTLDPGSRRTRGMQPRYTVLWRDEKF